MRDAARRRRWRRSARAGRRARDTAAAGAAAASRPVGELPDGGSAAEVVGHLDQNIDAMTGFGYLTRIRGLHESVLFAGARDESGARFTFAAKATVHERFLRGSMIAANAT